MLIVGLTGGIASGKSTVSNIFRELGAVILDADQIAREVVEPGQPALAEIVETFGEEMLRADGTLDREALAKVVFADAEARERLEQITHPRIRGRFAELVAGHIATGEEMIFYDAALLIESKLTGVVNVLVVVAASEENQLARLVGRDGMEESAARARLAAQLPTAEKVALADHVIWNDGTLEELRARVEEVWAAIEDQKG